MSSSGGIERNYLLRPLGIGKWLDFTAYVADPGMSSSPKQCFAPICDALHLQQSRRTNEHLIQFVHEVLIYNILFPHGEPSPGKLGATIASL